MPNLDNEPRSQFRGVFVPASVFELLDNGTITSIEFCLLLTVDRYTRMKGLGCWASNRKLAENLNLSISQVKKVLAKLTKTGLLRRMGTVRSENSDRRVLVVEYPPNFDLNCNSVQTPRSSKNDTPRVSFPIPVLEEEVLNTVEHRRPMARQIEKEDEYMDGSSADGFYHNSEVTTNHSKTKKPTTPMHHYFAKRLRKALVKANVINPFRESSWAQEFRRLEDSLKSDDAIDQIDAALSWYCDMVKKPYVPVAFSAKSFRDKFHSVVAAMNRANKDVPEEIEISKEAEEIFGRLKFLTWPKGTKDELKTVVQLSLDRYREFSRRYSALLKEAKVYEALPSEEQNREKHLVKLYRFVQYQKLQSPATIVEMWMRNTLNRISFDGWVGSSLLPHVWSMDHKLFKEEWEARAANYGNPKCYTMLIEELSK